MNASNIEIGICTNPEKAVGRAVAGVDYVEIQANAVAPLQDNEFAAFRDSLREAGIPVKSANCFAPWSTRFFGPEADEAKFADYTEAIVPRLAELGVKTVVFGCGGSRRVPEGVPRETARETILRAVAKVAGTAARFGQTVAIEPLNSSECNIINSVGEAADMARACGLPNVKILADLYHMDKDGEPFSEIAANAGLLAHVHVAKPKTRKLPDASDAAWLRDAFSALKAADYHGLVSLESSVDDSEIQLVTASVDVIRAAAASA